MKRYLLLLLFLGGCCIPVPPPVKPEPKPVTVTIPEQPVVCQSLDCPKMTP